MFTYIPIPIIILLFLPSKLISSPPSSSSTARDSLDVFNLLHHVISHHSLWEIDELLHHRWIECSSNIAPHPNKQTIICIHNNTKCNNQFIGLVLHFWCVRFPALLALSCQFDFHAQQQKKVLRVETRVAMKQWWIALSLPLALLRTNLYVYLINQNTMNFEARERNAAAVEGQQAAHFFLPKL